MSKEVEVELQPKVIEVELYLKVKVIVEGDAVEEIKSGMIEQYNYTSHEVNDDGILAKAIVYASLNPTISSWVVANKLKPDYWDGVGNMQGLIKKAELNTED